jgi:hypothetical protein
MNVLRVVVFEFNVGGECWRWMDFTAACDFHMSLPPRLALE